VKRGDIGLVSLEAVTGRVGKVTRPCALPSPDEMNDHLATLIVALLSMQSQAAPFHVETSLAGKKVLEQCRAIDKSQGIRKLGTLPPRALSASLPVLLELFDEEGCQLPTG
jgi:mRNA interferase MazF